MRCERARELLGAYIDNELHGDERAIAAHLAECRSCAALADDFRRIGGFLAQAGREPVPNALSERIRRNISQVPEIVSEAGAERAGSAASWPSLRSSLFRHAAIVVAASMLSALVTWWAVSSANQVAQLEHDVLSAHVRSLLLESPVQVAASDTHVVKPWFAGRVDFAPEVKDLTSEGFPLVGGRVDYVAGRRVGALVYRRRLHTINVFMWPGGSREDATPRLATRNGYNLLTWSRKGLEIWAISDLNAGDLRELQALL